MADNSGCTEWREEQEVTITLPEATIDSVLENCHPVNGWCTNSPTVSLTGSEPVDGEMITLIEGTRNGETFACPGDSCDVPGLEGENSFTFWAHSSWGDTSQMGTLSFKVDSEGPFIGIPDSWTIWEPLAIAVDDDHGVEQVSLTIHGGSYGNRHYSWNLPNLPNNWIWDRYFGDIVAPIGDYSVTINARDGLGNVSTEHATIIIPAPETDTEAMAALVQGDDGTSGDSSSEGSSAPDSGAGDNDAAVPELEPVASGSDAPESGSESVDRAAASSADTSAEPSASSVSEQPQTVVAPSSEGGSSGVLWGAAALAAIAGATAYGLNRKKQREAEIEAKRKEIAERRSERSFADHLASLRQAAEARIAPIRNAVLAAAAAATVVTERAKKSAHRIQALLSRLLPRLPGANSEAGRLAAQGLSESALLQQGVASEAPVVSPQQMGATPAQAASLDDPNLRWLIAALRAPGGIRDAVLWLATESEALNRFARETALNYAFSPFPDDPIGTMFRRLANELDRPPAQSTGMLSKVEDLIHSTAHNYRVNASLGYEGLQNGPFERLIIGLSDELKKPHHPETIGALSAIVLQVAGEAIAPHNPTLGNGLKDAGEAVGASADIIGFREATVAMRSLGSEAPDSAVGFLAPTSTLGRIFAGVGGLAGALQYGSSIRSLVADPALDPRVSGSEVWNERIGTMLEGAGGAMLAGGGATAFIPGGQPAAAVLLPAGGAVWGLGTIVKNWDEYYGGWQISLGAIKGTATMVLPYYASRAWDWYDSTVNTPIYDAAGTWAGIAANGMELVRAAPDYLKENVVNPVGNALNERVVEPVEQLAEDVLDGIRGLFGGG